MEGFSKARGARCSEFAKPFYWFVLFPRRTQQVEQGSDENNLESTDGIV